MTWTQYAWFAALFVVPFSIALFCQIKFPDKNRNPDDVDPYGMI
jgi:hypothetical protein